MTERCFDKSAEETTTADIADNYRIICENIAESMDKCARKDKVRIMAVTKTVPVEKINFAEGLGIELLGENRAQEFLEKYEKYSKKSEIHFIGGLQKNKVKYIIDKVTMIHSADSLGLCEEINRRAAAAGRVMDILFEINIADEQTKGGISAGGLYDIAKAASEMPAVRIRGLMTIPPAYEGEKYFAKMQEIYENAKIKCPCLSHIDTLSMGMSGDYVQAVRYGSTLVRIGSGLFGTRNYNR